jgi:hypothetical protein
VRLAVVLALAACAKDRPAADSVIYRETVDLAARHLEDPIGLPMRGTVDIDVELDHAKNDMRKATGTIRVRCLKGCRLGDDHAKLVPKAPRAGAFGSDGLYFGHIDFDSIDIEITVANGTATIARWNVASKDVELILSGDIKLASTIGDSVAALCLRFGATPALEQRDPRTAAVIELTGGPRSDKDGLFNIKLVDRIAQLKRLGVVCDGSAKPAEPPLVATDTARTPTTDVPPNIAALVAAAVKQTSPTTYSVDAAKWEQLVVDPDLMKGFRVVPAIKAGKALGFKLYAISPSSLFAHLGLQAGDTVTSVGGQSLAMPDKALEVYAKLRALRHGESVPVTLERGGASMTLIYTLE